MKVDWDYTALAAAYVRRPDYAPEAIDRMLAWASVPVGSRVCDVGAGVAHLTLALLQRNMIVDAVEPNDAMRALGIERSRAWSTVRWFDGTGEATGMADAAYDLVTFGSSFNVCDRQQALRETVRILVPGGWFACMWNHRDLDDPLQKRVEALISAEIPAYGYGTRREDQTAIIDDSGLFGPVEVIEGRIDHQVPASAWVEAWRSHATLARQAGDRFLGIVDRIAAEVAGCDTLTVPYTTRIWMARRR